MCMFLPAQCYEQHDVHVSACTMTTAFWLGITVKKSSASIHSERDERCNAGRGATVVSCVLL